jgi:hypothetical protein
MYCRKCHNDVKGIQKNGFLVCPKCQGPLKKELSSEEKTLLIQSLHQRENRYRDRNDTALSGVVLGVTFLIIGFVFFYLSFKLNLADQSDNTKYLTTDSVEFYIAMVGLVGGGGAFLYGIIQFFFDLRKIRVLKHDAAEIQKTSSAQVGKTGAWLPEFEKALSIKIQNRKKLRQIERTQKPNK